ncbi:hypothetical protein HELRODRAFT_187817 [Helobdella robusta]|uniref:TNFR-Cys domain-containing protein n=1 Tax=Helobdella robusta TaxID=6412 RepID=T1FPE4_HELRO|nr:hypothetical protein HELRODRAFT_187817 [Helobdella robusta]ESO12265.1 hypothetical protein HELRODRAFT_187817 [Helobdella robusta]
MCSTKTRLNLWQQLAVVEVGEKLTSDAYTTLSTQCTSVDASYTCNSCSLGYSAVGGTCKACGFGCASCTGSSFCTSCIDNTITVSKDVECPPSCSPDCACCSSSGKGKCDRCNDGYYLDLVTRTCTVCPTFCTTCAHGAKCLTCSSGYYVDAATSLCKSCGDAISGCLTCSDKTTCTKCSSSKFLSGSSCTACSIANCMYCSATDTCSECNAGYYLQSSKCNGCNVDKCLNCDTEDNCITCVAGFYASSGTCVACDASCQTCSGSSTSCVSCSYKYSKSTAAGTGNGVCYACNVENCDKCGSEANKCTTCRGGFTLVAASGTCSVVVLFTAFSVATIVVAAVLASTAIVDAVWSVSVISDVAVAYVHFPPVGGRFSDRDPPLQYLFLTSGSEYTGEKDVSPFLPGVLIGLSVRSQRSQAYHFYDDFDCEARDDDAFHYYCNDKDDDKDVDEGFEISTEVGSDKDMETFDMQWDYCSDLFANLPVFIENNNSSGNNSYNDFDTTLTNNSIYNNFDKTLILGGINWKLTVSVNMILMLMRMFIQDKNW